MKKIFTLIAATLMAASVNAQSWVLPTGVSDGKIANGTILLDNDFATVTTANNDGIPYVLQDEAGNPTTEKVGSYTFQYGVNVRVDAAPSQANPTGTPHTGDDGNANIAIVVAAKQNTDVTFYIRIGSTKSFDGYDQTTGETVSGNLVADNPDGANLYAASTFQLKGGDTYTFYTRGGTTRLYAIDTAEGTYLAPTSNIYANAGASVVDGFSTMKYADGAKVALTGNADKAFSSGSSITIDGKTYTSTKVSNGAANTFYAPEGKKVYTFTIYSYVNIDAENRTPYWAEVGDKTYTAEDANIMQSYKDGKNPDINTYTFTEGLSEVVFKNAGEQVCFVLEVDYTAPTIGGGEVAGARKWDFTNWSEATVANLKADAALGTDEGWSDDEKNDGNTELTAGNCFWAITTPNANGELLANGVVIEELKGLVFGANVNNRGMAIAVNYPSTELGTYHGPAYLWLGGKNKQFFTIPAVAGGSTIKMGVESHKNTDARGVDLLVNGASIGQFTPTTYDEKVWTVPAGEAVDVVVDNTNGCHIYFIEVADATSIQEVVKVINNGAVYNLAGQKVDESYKGVVIKNGKKFVQK